MATVAKARQPPPPSHRSSGHNGNSPDKNVAPPPDSMAVRAAYSQAQRAQEDQTSVEKVIVAVEIAKTKMEHEKQVMEKRHTLALETERNKQKRLQSLYDELQQDTARLQEQMNRREVNLKRLRQQLKVLEDREADESYELKRKNATIEALRCDLKKTQRRNEELTQLVEGSTIVFSGIQSQCADAAQQVDQLRQELRRADDDKDTLRRRISVLEQENVWNIQKADRYEAQRIDVLVERECIIRSSIAFEADREFAGIRTAVVDDHRSIANRQLTAAQRELSSTKEALKAENHNNLVSADQRWEAEIKKRQGLFEKQLGEVSEALTTSKMEQQLLQRQVAELQADGNQRIDTLSITVETGLERFQQSLWAELHQAKEQFMLSAAPVVSPPWLPARSASATPSESTQAKGMTCSLVSKSTGRAAPPGVCCDDVAVCGAHLLEKIEKLENELRLEREKVHVLEDMQPKREFSLSPARKTQEEPSAPPKMEETLPAPPKQAEPSEDHCSPSEQKTRLIAAEWELSNTRQDNATLRLELVKEIKMREHHMESIASLNEQLVKALEGVSPAPTPSISVEHTSTGKEKEEEYRQRIQQLEGCNEELNEAFETTLTLLQEEEQQSLELRESYARQGVAHEADLYFMKRNLQNHK